MGRRSGYDGARSSSFDRAADGVTQAFAGRPSTVVPWQRLSFERLADRQALRPAFEQSLAKHIA